MTRETDDRERGSGRGERERRRITSQAISYNIIIVLPIGFHLEFSSRGGGANVTIAELKRGSKDCSNTVLRVFFESSIKNITVME